MKLAIKIILAVIGGLLILLIIAASVLIAYVDVLAERAVERGATNSLGVESRLDSIRLSLISTRGTIHRFHVANPSGFSTPHFLTLEDGTVTLDAASALGDRVVIPSITFNGIDINLEEKDGKKNYNVIIANLKAYQSTMPKTKEQAADRPGKKFVIHEVVINGVNIHTDTLHGVGGKLQRIDLNIPQLVLKDIGNDKDNGVAMEQVTGAIMTSLFEAIATNGVGVLPLTVLGGLTDGVIDLSKLGGSGVKVLGDVANEVGKDTVEAVEKTGKGAVDAVGKGLNGLLGGEKKK